jgi:hypothetical protein
MPTSEQCRVYAAECETRAKAETSTQRASTYRAMRRTWNMLANQTDRLIDMFHSG